MEPTGTLPIRKYTNGAFFNDETYTLKVTENSSHGSQKQILKLKKKDWFGVFEAWIPSWLHCFATEEPGWNLSEIISKIKQRNPP